MSKNTRITCVWVSGDNLTRKDDKEPLQISHKKSTVLESLSISTPIASKESRSTLIMSDFCISSGFFPNNFAMVYHSRVGVERKHLLKEQILERKAAVCLTAKEGSQSRAVKEVFCLGGQKAVVQNEGPNQIIIIIIYMISFMTPALHLSVQISHLGFIFGNIGNFGKFKTRSQFSSSGSARLLVTIQSKILLLLAAT